MMMMSHSGCAVQKYTLDQLITNTPTVAFQNRRKQAHAMIFGIALARRTFATAARPAQRLMVLVDGSEHSRKAFHKGKYLQMKQLKSSHFALCCNLASVGLFFCVNHTHAFTHGSTKYICKLIRFSFFFVFCFTFVCPAMQVKQPADSLFVCFAMQAPDQALRGISFAWMGLELDDNYIHEQRRIMNRASL
jgi:hypothetical protein